MSAAQGEFSGATVLRSPAAAPTLAEAAPVPLESPDNRLLKRTSSRRQYVKRTKLGLCGYFGCSASAEVDRKYCRKHLDYMSRRQKKRTTARKKKSLCVVCGKLPQWWGVRCLVCRQSSRDNSLPIGARRALRLYREAERELQTEQLQATARCAVRKLLATGKVNGHHAEALCLFAGLDGGRWRNGVEVGKLMGISRERVRQLLYPSKIILTEMLGGNVPWKPLSEKSPQTSAEKSWQRPKWTRRRVTTLTESTRNLPRRARNTTAHRTEFPHLAR